MDIETLLPDFMAHANDTPKSDGTDADRPKKVPDAEHWAEKRYAEISNKLQAR